VEVIPESTVSVVGTGNNETGGGNMVASATGTGVENVVAGMEGGFVQSAEALFDMNGWDLNWVEFPDWNYLAQSLAVMGQEGGNYPVG
jgi:hypothetical protein